LLPNVDALQLRRGKNFKLNGTRQPEKHAIAPSAASAYAAIVQKNDLGVDSFSVVDIFWSLVFSLLSAQPSMIFLASSSSSPHTIMTA
jgi:hypothetical protein